MNKAQSDIEGIYGKGEVCMSEGKCLALEPGKFVCQKENVWP